jgi:hypothetical protein
VPRKQEHLDKADENERLAMSLDLATPGAASWAMTMLFYAALHFVEAYFATKGFHHRSHVKRTDAINNDPALRSVAATYGIMQLDARNARYEAVPCTSADVAKMKANLDRIKAHITPVL